MAKSKINLPQTDYLGGQTEEQGELWFLPSQAEALQRSISSICLKGEISAGEKQKYEWLSSKKGYSLFKNDTHSLVLTTATLSGAQTNEYFHY